jgi:acyl-CoA synthetase (AMP-forming)/AMP-acid ligase II
MADDRAPETIPASIARWAAITPDAPALLGSDGEIVSYSQLQQRLEAMGSALAWRGIESGDRIAIALPDGVRHAIAMLAAIRHAVAVPVNPAAPPREVADVLAAVQPRALLVAQGIETAWRETATEGGLPICEIDDSGALAPGTGVAGPPIAPAPSPAADELAMILLTSGTTGQSRRVPVSHGALLQTSAEIARDWDITARDRGLSASPGHSIVTISHIADGFVSGGSVIVVRSADVVQSPEVIRDLAPTWSWITPALLEALLHAAPRSPAIREWPLRFVGVGGAQVTPDLIARGEALWGVPVLNGYGTTETLAYIAGEQLTASRPRKIGSVGELRAGMEVVIRSEDGAALPPDEIGEITAQTRGLFSGYLDDPEATAAAFFPGGWYRTGDLGYLDEGYLFVTGRLQETINRGGEKIAPHEVDEALRAHPAVTDAAAFSLPSARLGEEVAAAVVFRGGQSVSARTLRHWVGDRLAPHKIPHKIWFVAEIPRTGLGKVQRRVLTELYRERSQD